MCIRSPDTRLQHVNDLEDQRSKRFLSSDQDSDDVGTTSTFYTTEKRKRTPDVMYIILSVSLITLVVLLSLTGLGIYIYITERGDISKLDTFISALNTSDIGYVTNLMKNFIKVSSSLNVTDAEIETGIQNVINLISGISNISDVDKFFEDVYYLVNEACRLFDCSQSKNDSTPSLMMIMLNNSFSMNTNTTS